MAADMGKRYRARSVTTYGVDGGLAFLVAHGTAETFVIDAKTAAVLDLCLAERSIESHVAHASRALQSGDAAAIRARIDDLVARGLLVSVEGLPASAGDARGSDSHGGANISALAIVTADRPAQFARCITSYLRHLGARGRTLPVIVVDASSDESNARQVEAIVTDVRKRTGATIERLGAHSRSEIRSSATACGVEASVMDWLLPAVPVTGSAGPARNHLLLSTIGRAILSVDDDTVGEVWASPEREESLAFAGHRDPRETRFFPTRAEAEAFALRHGGPADLIAQHEAVLGRTLQSLSARWPGGRDLEDVCAHLLPALDGLSPDWSVRATWAGVAGDAATHCPYPILFVAGDTRDRLAASENALNLALSSREVVRSVRRPTVTHEPWLMTYCAAIDSRTIVPPFSNVIRDEDRLFGATLRMCEPSAFVAQVPCGIVHDSSRSSLLERGVIPSADVIRTSDVVQWLAAPWVAAQVKSDAADRMHELGVFLDGCGRLSPAAWRARLTSAVVDARRRTLIAVEQVLSRDFQYPDHYRRAIRRYQQALLDSIRSDNAIVPLEYRDRPSLDRAMEDLQHYLVSFGEALMAWPTIWEAQKR